MFKIILEKKASVICGKKKQKSKLEWKFLKKRQKLTDFSFKNNLKQKQSKKCDVSGQNYNFYQNY